MNKFYKVSFDQFRSAIESISKVSDEAAIKALYDSIKLPKQATKGSAGHDFFSPFEFGLPAGTSIKIPTGIRMRLNPNRFLAIFPRSGLGFKYRLQLDNTVGILDEDYVFADNEGHIFIKMTNDSRTNQHVTIQAGEAFAQGIILPYEIAEGAEADSKDIRTGGFGSTDKVVEFGNANT